MKCLHSLNSRLTPFLCCVGDGKHTLCWHVRPRCKQKPLQTKHGHQQLHYDTDHSSTSCQAAGFCFDVACQREKDVLFTLSIALPVILAAAAFFLFGRKDENEASHSCGLITILPFILGSSAASRLVSPLHQQGSSSCSSHDLHDCETRPCPFPLSDSYGEGMYRTGTGVYSTGRAMYRPQVHLPLTPYCPSLDSKLLSHTVRPLQEGQNSPPSHPSSLPPLTAAFHRRYSSREVALPSGVAPGCSP